MKYSVPEFTLVSCPTVSIADIKAKQWPLKVTDTVTGKVSQVGDREIEAIQLLVELVDEGE
jgi:hypothetical protein